jgi:hypothetical protein
MREIIYIGEELPAAYPGFLLPYHDKEGNGQFTAEQVEGLVALGAANVRVPTEEEMAGIEQAAALIGGAVSLLQGFAKAVNAATGA